MATVETEVTKVCKECSRVKSLDEYYVRKDRNNAPHATCKECSNTEQDKKKFAKLSLEKQEQVLQHRQQKAHLEQGKKQCLSCKEVKVIEEYMTQVGIIKYSHCSSCRPDWEKQYFDQNPEKRIGRDKTRLKNRELVISTTLSLKEAGCADCKRYYPDAMEFDHTCSASEKRWILAEFIIQEKVTLKVF